MLKSNNLYNYDLISQEFLETCCQKVEECLQSITHSHFGIDDESTHVCKIRREFKFLCCNPKCKSSSEPHYLVPSPKGQTSDLPLLCKASTIYRKPTPEEMYWFPEKIKVNQVSQTLLYLNIN